MYKIIYSVDKFMSFLYLKQDIPAEVHTHLAQILNALELVGVAVPLNHIPILFQIPCVYSIWLVNGVSPSRLVARTGSLSVRGTGVWNKTFEAARASYGALACLNARDKGGRLHLFACLRRTKRSLHLVRKVAFHTFTLVKGPLLTQ